MTLPVPNPKSMGSSIVNRLNQLSQNEMLKEQILAAQQQNQIAPQMNQLKMQQMQEEGKRQNDLFPEKLKQLQMSNQLYNMELGQYLPKTQAETSLKSAQANNLNLLNKLPFAGRQLPGEAGKSLAVDMIKQQYGEQSPQYMMAKNAYDLEQQKAKQTMEYQRSLMGSQNKRSATPMGKMFMEMDEVENGFMPGTVNETGQGAPISEEQQKKLINQYREKMIKDITDPKLRERALFAKNMEKTINTLNPEFLTYYSGPKGQTKLAKDMTLSAAGKDVPKYKEYKKALTSAQTLTKQVRQFYGDSITPSVQEGLKNLANPTSWFENPQVAMARYNQFVNILDTEADTFFDALKDPSMYEKNHSMKSKVDNDPLGIR